MTTKERILDIAREMISQHGFHGTTTAALAKEAGISEGTIYRHYESKEDILLNILNGLDDKYSRFIHGLRHTCMGDPGTIERIVRSHFRFLEDNAADVKIVLSSYAYLDPTKESMTTIIDRMKGFFKECLGRSHERGVTRDVPLDETALIMVTMLLGIMRLKLYWPEMVDIKEPIVEFCRRSIVKDA